jgi:surfeit locus 1 family protein
MAVQGTRHRPASRAAYVLTAALLLVALVLAALGTWQVQRLAWKRDLISQVQSRLAAAPVPPPPRQRWPSLTSTGDEYRRIAVTGTFLHASEVLVAASTEAGPGYWVMTPMQLADGSHIFVNRGFVTSDRRNASARAAGNPAGTVTVTGLLRIGEGAAWILRRNDPASGRWYRRDPVELAHARGLLDTAPYFIDADATPNPGGWPAGGMTVVRFSNSHLVYAITWFVLAGMAIAGAALVWRSRRDGPPPL